MVLFHEKIFVFASRGDISSVRNGKYVGKLNTNYNSAET